MMNSEHDDSLYSGPLTTYIGYITGPRGEQPVGVRVVEPPPGTREHQRGNLYAIVDLIGQYTDRARISDRILAALQYTYYAAKGSQSQVMMEAVQEARRAFQASKAQASDVGILCASLLRGRLIVVSSGPAFALVRSNDKVHLFPSDLSNLGSEDSSVPGALEIYRQELRVDDVFFVGGGSWLKRVPIRTLASVVAFTNAELCVAAADELYEQGGQISLPGLLIVLGQDQNGPVPPEGSSRGGMPPSGSGGGPKIRRPRFGSLPTALGTSPPARMSPGPRASTATVSTTVAPPTIPSSISPSAAVPTASQVAESFGRVIERNEPQEEPSPAVDDRDEGGPVQEDADTGPGQSPVSGSSALSQAGGAVSAASSQVAGGLVAGLRQMRNLFVRMLPDPTSVHDPPPTAGKTPYPQEPVPQEYLQNEDAWSPPVEERDKPAGDSEAGVASDSAEYAELEAAAPSGEAELSPAPALAVDEVATPLSVPYAAPKPARGARARLFVLLALLILVLVPVVVFAVNWSEGNDIRAEAEQLTDAAAVKLLSAQDALEAGDKGAAREQLVQAQAFLMQAIELDGSNEHRNRLAVDIETELQGVLQIAPLYGLAEPLITFPPDARPARVLAVDEEIYVLDSGNQQILRYQFDPTSGKVTNPEGQVVLAQGDIIEGVSVGTLADMAWQPLIPGFEDRPSLLILDRNNNLFRYDQRVEGATLLQLAGQSEWRQMSQVQTYLGRIYLADEATGHILRYEPGQLGAPPEPWFLEQTPVNLAGLIGLEIDGDIWLLFNKGSIMRYSQGQQVPFSLENRIDFTSEPVDMYVTTRDGSTIYLVDAAQSRILVFDKTGEYRKQLTAPEGDLLRGISGLYIDEVTESMYILTQYALFKHPLPE